MSRSAPPTTALDSRRATVRASEAAIGNLIADAMRAAVGADVAITNGGGIRGNKEYPAGTQADPQGHLHRAAVRQQHGEARAHRRAILAGARERLQPDRRRRAAASRRSPASTIEVDPSKPAGLARRLGRRQRQAARRRPRLHGRHQRFHGGGRRRLHDVQGREAAAHRARRQADGQRRHGLCRAPRTTWPRRSRAASRRSCRRTGAPGRRRRAGFQAAGYFGSSTVSIDVDHAVRLLDVGDRHVGGAAFRP